LKGNGIKIENIGGSEAVSELIGVILMISLVIVGVAMVGVFVLGQSTPTEIPSLSMIPSTNDTDLFLYHAGGDSLSRNGFVVRVDGFDYGPENIILINQDGSMDENWDSWDLGETLDIPDKSDYSQILLISTRGGQGSLIASSGEGVYTPTATSTTTATSTATATVTETSTPSPGPDADFTANITSGPLPLSVQFTDLSTENPTSWFWDFGDGTNSTEQNPVHVYLAEGTYTVSLTVTNAGGSDTKTEINYITVSASLCPCSEPGLTGRYYSTTDFTGPYVEHTDGRIRFADPDTRYYSPGYESDIPNWPRSIISKSEVFSVVYEGYLMIDTGDDYTFYLTSDDGSRLSIDGTEVIDNNFEGIQAPTEESATVYLARGYHPIKVEMIDQQADYAVFYLEWSSPLFSRDFVNSTYLCVEDACSPPVADFTSDVLSGEAPLTVRFTDQSTNSPSSWLWDFGDGETSTDQNPVHEYTSGGTYTVSLRATNTYGSGIEEKTDYITVTVTRSNILLNTHRPFYLTSGSELEFNVTGQYSRLYFRGSRVNLPIGTNVRIVLRNDQDGSIESSYGSISTLEFDDANLYINGVRSPGHGSISNIYVSGYSDMYSTLSLVVPYPGYSGVQTYLVVDGTTVLPWSPSETPEVHINNMYPNSGNLFQLNSPYRRTYLLCSAESYELIEPSIPPESDFDYDILNYWGYYRPVEFTDTSYGNPTSWLWNFGDGYTSTEQNPIHDFVSRGKPYTVTLTVTNAYGSDSTSRFIHLN
jgi:PKD repeat protein